jgi:MFS family permease
MIVIEDTLTHRSNPNLAQARRRLPVALIGNALMRIAGGASGVLVGLYLAHLAKHGAPFGAALVGTLGAVSFTAELLFALPAGVLADAIAPRALMTGGALLGALATQLFGLSRWVGIFFLSRAMEGVASAAGVPPLLAHIAGITEGDAPLRARAMSYLELSLLAGLALGGFAAAQLWRAWGTGAFALVALLYVLCAGLLSAGAAGSRGYGRRAALPGLAAAVRKPSLRRLAPIWICVNSIIGLWLGPALSFLLTARSQKGQLLTGVFADRPERLGWMLVAYSLVFGAGVSLWRVFLPRLPAVRALRISLGAMFAVCGGLSLLNHSGAASVSVRWAIGVSTALCIMVESGFTPAALTLLAGTVGGRGERGAAMGIYSMLLSVGAIFGSLAAAVLGARFAVDGLISGTLALAAAAMMLMPGLERAEVRHVRL